MPEKLKRMGNHRILFKILHKKSSQLVLCVAVLDMETPCPSDALSARFSVRGNALTTFLFIVSKVWIVILSLNQIGFRT